MSIVDLPCEYGEWRDYQNVFILLSQARTLRELKLLAASQTRDEEALASPFSRCLEALKGLFAFLTEFYTPDEQKAFVTRTLPFVAMAASLLEERIPTSGISRLQKQESKTCVVKDGSFSKICFVCLDSALVLGRKVILSIMANAFLCTFPPTEEGTFSFESFFKVFLGSE